jgi:hypothetical protein
MAALISRRRTLAVPMDAIGRKLLKRERQILNPILVPKSKQIRKDAPTRRKICSAILCGQTRATVCNPLENNLKVYYPHEGACSVNRCRPRFLFEVIQ